LYINLSLGQKAKKATKDKEEVNTRHNRWLFPIVLAGIVHCSIAQSSEKGAIDITREHFITPGTAMTPRITLTKRVS
jgi:hypothetical protein